MYTHTHTHVYLKNVASPSQVSHGLLLKREK